MQIVNVRVCTVEEGRARDREEEGRPRDREEEGSSPCFTCPIFKCIVRHEFEYSLRWSCTQICHTDRLWPLFHARSNTEVVNSAYPLSSLCVFALRIGSRAGDAYRSLLASLLTCVESGSRAGVLNSPPQSRIWLASSFSN